MKKKEIKEYNKRCALFIGFYYKDDNNVQQIHNWITGLATMTYDPETYFKFDSDWNWIMEVCTSIKNKTNPKKNSDTTFRTLIREIQTHLGRVNKEATIEAINKFLIFYNEHNK